MTIATFQTLIDAYQKAREHTRWVWRHLDDMAQGVDARAAHTAAMDQENAALREVVEAARKINVKGMA